MATQQIEFEAPSGLSLTAKLYLAGSDTVSYTASAVTEQTNRKGIYRATFSSVAANTYQLIATSGATGVASWWGYAENTASTFQFSSSVGNLGAISDAVWDELTTAHTVNGSYGERVIRSTNSQAEVAVTGAHHIAADIHELQPAVINNTHFDTDAFDANALATSAVTEITTPILSLLAGTPIVVNQPVTGSNQRIDIIRGDTYNDIRKPKLRFTVSKNYTGCTINLTIRHRTSDAILLTKSGTVDSSTILSVELSGTDTAFSTLSLDEYGLHVFDLQATDGSGNRETIIVGGSAVLLLDQTR